MGEKIGLVIAGVWRTTKIASDMTAGLFAIKRSGAHMVFTIFSAFCGVTFIKQANELKISVLIGRIKVEAINSEMDDKGA